MYFLLIYILSDKNFKSIGIGSECQNLPLKLSVRPLRSYERVMSRFDIFQDDVIMIADKYSGYWDS